METRGPGDDGDTDEQAEAPAEAIGSENRGAKPAKKPRGKPFKKGEMPPTGRQFPKGQSGNPGGRPKVDQAFRERCESLSVDLLEHVYTRIRAGRLSMPQVVMIQSIWNHGGHIVPKKLEVGGDDGGPLKIDHTGELLGMLERIAAAGSPADEVEGELSAIAAVEPGGDE